MSDKLVIQLARFGDLVQTKRLLLSLAREESTSVHLAVDESLAALARRIYPFAQIHPFSAHSSGSGNVLQSALAAIAGMELFSAGRFDEVYNINLSPLSLALAARFEPESVRGYVLKNGQPLRSRWARIVSRLTRHRQSSALNLVDFWAYFHPEPVAPGEVNPDAKIGTNGRIGVVMSGRESRRSLPAQVLARVVEAAFQARCGPEVILLGSRAEGAAARRLIRDVDSRIGAKITDLTGKTALDDLPECLSGLDLVLTPDTGIMHLAAHLGVPAQAFFLSSAWAHETGPYGLGHTVWQASAHCLPCLESASCPNGLLCLPPFNGVEFQQAFKDCIDVRPKKSTPEELAPSSFPPGSIPGLLRLGSSFDELGLIFAADSGDDDPTERLATRRLLMNYLGIIKSGSPLLSKHIDIFQESDWILPDPVPVPFR